MIPILIRHPDRPSLRLQLSPDLPIHQLKPTIAKDIGLAATGFDLFMDGYLINCSLRYATLRQLGFGEGACLELVERSGQGDWDLEVRWGQARGRVMVGCGDTLRGLKQRICDMFGLYYLEVGLQVGGRVLEGEGVRVGEFMRHEGQVITVNKIETAKCEFGDKIRTAESVTSAENSHEQPLCPKPKYSNNACHLMKKSSCDGALQNIQSHRQADKNPLKSSGMDQHSAVVSESLNQKSKQKIKQYLDQMKQTISLGSLQQHEIEPNQLDIQVCSQDATMVYIFKCVRGCRIEDIGGKLARLHRVHFNDLQLKLVTVNKTNIDITLQIQQASVDSLYCLHAGFSLIFSLPD